MCYVHSSRNVFQYHAQMKYFMCMCTIYSVQGLRPQRRLYGIYSVSFLIFWILQTTVKTFLSVSNQQARQKTLDRDILRV